MKLKYYLRGLGIGIAVTAVVMGFSLGQSDKAAMTDEEIIAKAESLGMVQEDKILVKSQENDDKNAPGNDSQDKSVSEAPTPTKAPTKAPEPKATAKAVVTPEPNENAEKAEEADKAEVQEEIKKKAEEEAAKKAEEEAKKKAEEEAKKKAEEEAKKKAEEEAAKKAEEEAKKAADKNTTKATGSVNINVTPGSGSETVSNQLFKAGLVESATSFNAYLCSGGYDRKLTTGNHNVPAGASYEEIAKIMTSGR